MIVDNLFLFNNEAEAIADPVVGEYYNEAWRGDCCIAGVSVTQLIPGIDPETSEPTVTRQPWPYWYLIISDDNEDLRNHPACIVSIDWDNLVTLKSQLPVGTSFKDFEISPYFMGRDPTLVNG